MKMFLFLKLFIFCLKVVYKMKRITKKFIQSFSLYNKAEATFQNFKQIKMGCGTSMSDSQIIKQSTSPKKPSFVEPQSQNDLLVKAQVINKLNSSNSSSPHQDKKKAQKQNQETQSIQEQIKQEPSSRRQAEVNSQEIIPLIYQSLPPIKQGKIFLFGQSADERKIITLDLQQLKFQTLASRSRTVQSNPKYQPTDVIFQQSQQLQASHLYNKFSHPPYNFMFATYLNDEKIFLCGGINADFEYVSDEAFVYQIKKNQKISLNGASNFQNKNNLLGLKFQKLQYMNRKRYSHMGSFFPMGKLAYVYVFGGRGQDDETLTHCEKYSIYEKKWIQISPMKIPRSTGFSLIYRSKIYVFGGYTSEKKRSKKIEIYDPIKNYWEVLDVKLHRGIEAGVIFSTKPNEVLIMGGNMELGTLKSIIKVNLAEKTYQWDSNMKNDRFLQKGGKLGDQIFVFGGDFQDTFERYTLKDRKWRDQQVSYKDFMSPDDINSFTQASQTIQVKFDEALVSKTQQVNDFQRTHIFGNDQFPCILEINLNKWVLRKKPVPMALRLRCHMIVTKIKEGKYLIMGGIDSFNEKCSRAAFLYYAGTNKAIQTEKMGQKKFQMASCVFGESVYIFGGRNGLNGEILTVSQRFDLIQQKWKPLKNLSRQRTKAKTLVHRQQILIWGGCDSLQNLTQIQMYLFNINGYRFNPKTQQFSIYQKAISISSQIRGILTSPEKGSNEIVIFSYNDLLNEQYCHGCILDDKKEQNNQKKEQNIQDSGLICSQDLKIREIKVKLPGFNKVFRHGENLHFITSKGIQTWGYKHSDESHALKPQIIINQVEMLQFPIQKFSFTQVSEVSSQI